MWDFDFRENINYFAEKIQTILKIGQNSLVIVSYKCSYEMVANNGYSLINLEV